MKSSLIKTKIKGLSISKKKLQQIKQVDSFFWFLERTIHKNSKASKELKNMRKGFNTVKNLLFRKADLC